MHRKEGARIEILLSVPRPALKLRSPLKLRGLVEANHLPSSKRGLKIWMIHPVNPARVALLSTFGRPDDLGSTSGGPREMPFRKKGFVANGLSGRCLAHNLAHTVCVCVSACLCVCACVSGPFTSREAHQ